jgi:tetratricopeptide (TPR) repeat protein
VSAASSSAPAVRDLASISSPRKRYLLVVGAIVVAALVATGLYWRFHAAAKLTGKDSILIADFVNTTGDAVFDGTLKQALAVQLEQSPYLNIVPDQTVRKALQFMGRTADERVTGTVARELCEREHIQALLSGSISSLGSEYVVALEAAGCASGESLAREQVTASSKEAVLSAVGKAASKLRAKLGESLTSIQKFDTPVTEATTSSLEALKAYAAADQMRNSGGEAESLPLFQRAVQLDPNFALAHARISAVYNNFGEEDRSFQSAKRAFDLRDRVSERERFYIDDHYYTSIGDIEKQKENLELAIRTYPNDSSAYANLALLNDLFYGEFEKAIQLGDEFSRLEPSGPFGYVHTAAPYMALNRPEEARSTLQRALDNKADNLFVHEELYQLAMLTGDAAGMAREMTWAAGKPSEYLLLNDAADVAVSRGQMRKAGELIQRSSEVTDRLGFRETTADTKAHWALLQADVGNFAQVRATAAASSAIAHGRSNMVPVAIALAMAGDSSRAQAIMDDLGRRFPADTLLHKVGMPSVAAWVAINNKEPEQAVEALAATAAYELGVGMALQPIYIRGQAFLQAKQGAEAAAEFQKIIEHPGIAAQVPEHSLAKLGLGRSYVVLGDKAKAKAAYQDFFALWKDADPDVPVLKEAKSEYEKLQ